MGHNPEFQERWEFRRKEVNEDSSDDDDSKSNSEQVLKSQRLIVEDDYLSDNPTQIEPEVGNPRAKGKSKCKKPRKKLQTGVTKRNKRVNAKKELAAVKKPRRKKNNCSAYDPSLMEEFKSFSESLLEDMKATGEQLFAKMKAEMFELKSNRPTVANNDSSKVGYAQVLNARNLRYDQMPPGQEGVPLQGQWGQNRNKFTMNNMNQLPTRENANAVCDFPLAQHHRGLLLGRGFPNTSLNRPFIMSGQQHQNSESSQYLSGNIFNLQSSGRVDSNAHHIRQNSLNSFNLGMLPRNEARDQSHTWRATYGREIMEVEGMRNFKPDAQFIKDDTRQLQAMVDGRVAFHWNFCRPIMLREREYEQNGRLLRDRKFTENVLSPLPSSMHLPFPEGTPNSYTKNQLIRPPSNFIQHIASGNQMVMNEGFTRMNAEGNIQNVYLGMEQNLIRSIPQVASSDREQCNAPKYSISNR